MFTDPTVLFHWQTHQDSPAPTVIGIPIGLEAQQGGTDTLLRRTLCGAAWTVAVSEAILHDVRKLVPETASRSSVIYNSIDEPSITPLPLPFDPPRLLCLGRMVHEKGFDTAIDAFSRMRRGSFPGIKLVIAGDGPARAGLAAQAAALGLGDSVEFTGWIQPEDVPALINSATAMIIPSRWREAFGNIAVQAMQMERPVVAADVGGLPEIVIDGTTGYLVPTENPVILAEAMERLLTQPETAKRLGAAGRARAASQFPFERYVAEHEKLYRTIIGEYQLQS
jgi:glycogen(starch) synthase